MFVLSYEHFLSNDEARPSLVAASFAEISNTISQTSAFLVQRPTLASSDWLGPSSENDAKAQARLAAELRRFSEVFDQNASIRFDDAL
jgi:hypothetical protein